LVEQACVNSPASRCLATPWNGSKIKGIQNTNTADTKTDQWAQFKAKQAIHMNSLNDLSTSLTQHCT